ncbi:MAG: radical SAM protein, partial [Bacteroidales bacterium]|nr:radical SAM protein [Bacteroidales bacterium]
MSAMLFEDIIFGPIKSRRLGNSLGLNLLPVHKKLCNFNCVYCECGWNED